MLRVCVTVLELITVEFSACSAALLSIQMCVLHVSAEGWCKSVSQRKEMASSSAWKIVVLSPRWEKWLVCTMLC